MLFNDYDKETGMDLFSETNEFMRTISVQDAQPVAWRPDSNGLFYITDALYYIEFPNGEPFLIDTCGPEGCKYRYNETSFIWSFP